jgi:hypothetical protein
MLPPGTIKRRKRMYRPFKEYLNEAFAQWAGEHAPEFLAVKSLARGGGVTLRWRLRKDLAWFLVLQHVADRDRASVCAGWARGAWFNDWAAAENHYIWLRGNEDRAAFRAALRGKAVQASTPAQAAVLANAQANVQEHAPPPAHLPEACFTADLLAYPGDPGVATTTPLADIELLDADGTMGVPYELVLARLREQPGLRRPVGIFMGEEITASLLEGNVPPFMPPNPALGLREPARVGARLLSWEIWFEHVLQRAPTQEELTELCAPARTGMLQQAGMLLEKCREMAGNR